jgi:uncharacterized protein
VRTNAISEQDCSDFLKRVSTGRLACSLNGEPYVVPISFAYEPGRIYVFSTVGQKVKWMRQNPRVCLQADEIRGYGEWMSVIVNGAYQELHDPEQKDHARNLLSKRSQWWLNSLAERRELSGDLAVEPVFFCIKVASMSGLRSEPESK